MATKKNTVTYNGTGRRKTSVARVFMTPGTGNITVNGKTLEDYLPLETLRMVVRSPLELTETLNQFDIKDEDRESLITEDPIVICSGKKNIEQIDAYLNVLGTRIVYDVETAEGDEWFED